MNIYCDLTWLRPIVLLIILMLNSCALLGPNFKKPQVNMPSNWSKTPNFQVNTQEDLSHRLWWQQFKNPELDSFIKIALHNNNSLKIAMANLERSRSELLKTKL